MAAGFVSFSKRAERCLIYEDYGRSNRVSRRRSWRAPSLLVALMTSAAKWVMRRVARSSRTLHDPQPGCRWWQSAAQLRHDRATGRHASTNHFEPISRCFGSRARCARRPPTTPSDWQRVDSRDKNENKFRCPVRANPILEQVAARMRLACSACAWV